MPASITHVCLSVRGALRNYTKRDLKTLFLDETGRRLTADEAKEVLFDELAKGHEVIPVGEPCQGFDYSGGGCPGHPGEAT